MTSPVYDIAIIGGGLVGLATALQLLERERYRLIVLEAEAEVARHQSGRNSGVVHSGLYYPPGSLKARLCTHGRERLYRFCRQRGIPHRRCGKLVVASDERQLAALAELERRAAANGLDGVERLDAAGIRKVEPAAAGVAGLWVPQTGVVDFRVVARALATELQQRRQAVATESRVERIRRHGPDLRLSTHAGELHCRGLVNCAGLHSDRVARLAGLDPEIRIVPFRGEYFELAGDAAGLVRGLIYPVPDARLPFLGVHLTRTVDDRVLAGPSALPAGRREGYRRRDLSLADLGAMLSFPGFWRLAGRFWRTGLAELHRSLSRRRFAADLQRLVPALTAEDLRRAPCGVRAQALDRTGRLIDDFHILERERMVHVLNAPSPAATASLAIGERIAELATAALG